MGLIVTIGSGGLEAGPPVLSAVGVGLQAGFQEGSYDLGIAKVPRHLTSRGCGVCCHSNLVRLNSLTALVNKHTPSTCYVPGTGDTKRNRTWSPTHKVLIVSGGERGGGEQEQMMAEEGEGAPI